MMKIFCLFPALFACAVAACAQPVADAGGADMPLVAPELPFVAPDEATKLTLKKPLVFHLRELTLFDALQQLKAQSGVNFSFSRRKDSQSLDKTLSLDLETLSFDEAFKGIFQAAGVSGYLQANGSSAPLYLIYDGIDLYGKLPRDERGAFVTRLRHINSSLSETIDLSKNLKPTLEKNNFLNVTVWVWPDLRLPVMGAPLLRVTRALDDKGRSLLLEDVKPESTNFFDGNDARKMQPKPLVLKRPAADAERLAKLEGVATFVMGLRNERWEEPDALAQFELTHKFESNGQQIEIKARNKLNQNQTVDFSIDAIVPAPPAPGAMPHPLFSPERLADSVTLEDAQGYILRARTGNATINREGTKINTYTTFQLTGDRNPAFSTPDVPDEKVRDHKLALPLKFVFDTPTDWVKTEVPFAFSDLPLPPIPTP